MGFISLKNVRKVYRVGNEKVVALGRVNIEIERGEICCILGTSGSGKSTLLNIMAGLEKLSRGTVTIANTNVTGFSEKKWALFRQKNIGFVFQSYGLMPSLTALENVAMPLVFMGTGKNERFKRSAHMLKAVGLGDRMLHKPTQMSGGQQQRVGIARAFVSHPKIMGIMVSMAEEYGETLVIVTHDLEIAKFARRIITIHDGYVVNDSRSDTPGGSTERKDAV